MTEKGDPLENALEKRVNGILKQELLEEVFPDYPTVQKKVAIECSTDKAFIQAKDYLHGLKDTMNILNTF